MILPEEKHRIEACSNMAQTAQVATKRKPTAAGLPTGGRVVKRRASKACQCCRSRKVRCDVVDSGIPCTNCRLDEVECCVTEGKRRKKSVVKPDLPHRSPAESVDEGGTPSQFPAVEDIDGFPDLSVPNKYAQSPSSTLSSLEQELSHHKPHMLCKLPGPKSQSPVR